MSRLIPQLHKRTRFNTEEAVVAGKIRKLGSSFSPKFEIVLRNKLLKNDIPRVPHKTYSGRILGKAGEGTCACFLAE